MMRTRRGWMGALVGALVMWTAPALAQVEINVDMNVVPTDGTAAVTVSLAAGGASVGGMQNDLVFDNTIVNLARPQDCRINAAIGLFPSGEDCTVDSSVGPCKNLNSVIQTCPGGDGCPSGAGSNISVFRAIIAATAAPNNNAIPDGALYTCTFQVVNAGALPATLTNSNVVVSDPVGTRLDSTGTDGSIGEGDGPTPTPTSEPTATVTVPPGGALVSIGSADPDGAPTVAIDVTLSTDGASVGGMQNDIVFNNTIVNLARVQDCRINAAIGLFPNGEDCTVDSSVGPCKNLNSVIQTCPGGDGCPDGAGAETSVFRAIIAATAAPNNNEIPDGVLYTCTFQVVNAAALPTTLEGSNVVVSDPFGTRLDAAIANGSVGPIGPPIDTPTPTEGVPPTNTPVPPSATPVTPATNTPVGPTATAVQPTATATMGETPAGDCTGVLANPVTAAEVAITLVNADCFPTGGGTIQIGTTNPRGYTERIGPQLFLVDQAGSAFPAGTVVTLIRGGGDDDDGCHINAKASNSNAWLLLIPIAGLLALRRKQW